MSLSLVGCLPDQVVRFDRTQQAGAVVGGVPADWSARGGHRVSNIGVTGWVEDFGDSALVALSKEAVDNNFNLQAALSRVFQAEERARALRAASFPNITAAQGNTRSQVLNARGEQVQTRRYSLDMRLRWELDLWKRLDDLKEAQLATMDAQYHGYQAARLSLVASVMRAAFELAESSEQIRLLQRNLESLQTNLDILDSRLEAGDADDRTALDITLSKTDIARARANLVAQRRDQDNARRQLETLLGRYPEGVIKGITRLPELKAHIPVGLPCDLLMRRPDILQAEMQINNALYGLSANEKRHLPSLVINGDLGTSSSEKFSNLLDLNNLVYSIGRSITAPVFDAQEIDSDIRRSEHARDEAIKSYANVVLQAFLDVESALSAEQYFNDQIAAQEDFVREAKVAEELSLSNYEAGLINIITLLESQRRSVNAQSDLLTLRLRRLNNRVDLYLALGGDFATQPICVATPVVPASESRMPRVQKALDWYRAEARP